MREQKEFSKYFFIFPLILLIIYFWFVNKTTFLMAEDFSYSLLYKGDVYIRKIQSFKDVIYRVIDTFYFWDGRIFSSFLNTFSLYLGLDVFRVVNGFVIASQLFILIIWITNKKFSKKQMIVISVLMTFCLFYVPSTVFDEVFIFHTASMYYSVPTLIILIYLTPYVMYVKNGKLHITKIMFIVWICVSILSGLIPENYSIASFVISFIIMIYIYFTNKTNIDKRTYVPLLINFLSIMLCVFSPGTQNRIHLQEREVSLGLKTITQYFRYQYTYVPFATILFFVVTLIVLYKTLINNKKIITSVAFVVMLPVMLAALFNTQLLWKYDFTFSNFITHLRLIDDFYIWSGATRMLEVSIAYFCVLTLILLCIYTYVALRRNDMMLVVLLLGATLPILLLIFVGGAEQKVVYWPFLSCLSLSAYCIFNYLDLNELKTKLIIICTVIVGVYCFCYHTEYVVYNIDIVAQREKILSNLENTTGDIILPKVRASLHGNVNEDSWYYDVMKIYYDIEEREIRSE